MKKNYLLVWVAMAVVSSASLAFGTTTYDTAILGDSPVSYWPMQETVGPTIHDVVSTNNGTMYMGTTLVPNTGGEYYSAWAVNNGSAFGMGGPGILHNVPNDTAIYFTNLNNTFISVPYSASLNTATFTVEAWFNIPNYPHNFSYLPSSEAFTLLDFMYNGDQPCLGWELNVENGEYQDADAYQAGVINCFLGKPDGTDWNLTIPTQQYTNQWAYTTMTYNGTTLKLYVDGIQITTATEGFGQMTGAHTNAIGLLMGAQMPKEPPIFLGQFYEGGMSHVACYNYALTTSQITNHYYIGHQGGVLQLTPSISAQPVSQTNYVGQTATFNVNAAGQAPLFYQWLALSNGVYANLSAGGQFSGVTNSTLTISSLVLSNTTNYEVVVTNSLGSVTSTPAMLTVLTPTAPSIITSPSSQTNYVGQTATFVVSASGTAPLLYQWQVEVNGIYVNLNAGGQFSAVTNTTLTISSLALTNSTNYEVIVTNSAGSVTSAPATLTVVTNALPTTYQGAILGDNPVAYWPMQETNGTTIADVTSNGNTGTMYVSTDASGNGEIHASFIVSNSGFTLGAPGMLTNIPGDTSIYFNTVNAPGAEIAVPYNTNLDTVNFSGEAWLRIPTIPISYTGTATSNNMTDLTVFGPTSGGGDSAHTSWQVDLNLANGGRVDAWVGKGTNGWSSITSGATGQSGKVVCVVETYDGANLRLYTNGSLVGVVATTHTNQAAGGHTLMPFVLGSYQQDYFLTSTPVAAGYERARFYTGGMAHVAVYNYALSAVQVTNHYYASTLSGVLPPPTPTLSIQRSGTNVSLSWTNGFLQKASSAKGPWTDVLPTNQTSPQVIAATNSQLFFRASSQP